MKGKITSVREDCRAQLPHLLGLHIWGLQHGKEVLAPVGCGPARSLLMLSLHPAVQAQWCSPPGLSASTTHFPILPPLL